MLGRGSLFFSVFVTVPLILFWVFTALIFGPFDFFIGLIRHGKPYGVGTLGPIVKWLKRQFYRSVLAVNGVKIDLRGKSIEELKKLEGCVFVANHQSLIDIPVMMFILPERTTFMAKKELKKVPFFGWACSIVGILFVDRAKGAGNEALREVKDVLQKGVSLVIYPEGTRSKDGTLGPFKRGAFVIAIQAQAPIVPITICNTKHLNPKKKLTIQPGTVRVVAGDPIPTSGMKEEDRFELSDRVRAIVEKNLRENAAI